MGGVELVAARADGRRLRHAHGRIRAAGPPDGVGRRRVRGLVDPRRERRHRLAGHRGRRAGAALPGQARRARRDGAVDGGVARTTSSGAVTSTRTGAGYSTAPTSTPRAARRSRRPGSTATTSRPASGWPWPDRGGAATTSPVQPIRGPTSSTTAPTRTRRDCRCGSWTSEGERDREILNFGASVKV